MKRKSILLMVATFFLCACPTLGTIYLNDGLIHNIDYEINDSVHVDYMAPEMYTTVNVLDGGSIDTPYYLWGFENSRINILGGHVHYLDGYDWSRVSISGGVITSFRNSDFCQANISGGVIGSLDPAVYSQVNISGGEILNLESYDFCQVNISGGEILLDLRLWDQSEIRIFGYDFAVDGQPFGYGELTSIFGDRPYDEPFKHLTGTLLSGELFDNDFRIGHDARIVLIPEPGTVLLLGLGGLFLKRRKS